MKQIFTVIANRWPDTGSYDETRAQVVCPVDGKSWSSIAIGTDQGLYYDPVECDCGNVLVPAREVQLAIHFTGSEHGKFVAYFPGTDIPLRPEPPELP